MTRKEREKSDCEPENGDVATKTKDLGAQPL